MEGTLCLACPPQQSSRNAQLAATPRWTAVTDGPQYGTFPREGKQIFYHCIDRSISIYIFFRTLFRVRNACLV